VARLLFAPLTPSICPPVPQVLPGASDVSVMRHVAEARRLMEVGKSREALDVLDNLLGLAPRNHEALRLKAALLDAQGRFDESLLILRDLSRFDGLSDEALRDLERRTLEEREVSVYSELTPEGRWYLAFPPSQLWISLYGFLGCAFFLIVGPWLIGDDTAAALPRIGLLFSVFVALPWLALVVVHMVGIKRILVGLNELKICTRFRERIIPWESVTSATLEHHVTTGGGQLYLVLRGRAQGSDSQPASELARLNVSARRSVVRARRHFVRSILTHVDVVSYVILEPNSKSGLEPEGSPNAKAG
jgi:hypothetical protein